MYFLHVKSWTFLIICHLKYRIFFRSKKSLSQATSTFHLRTDVFWANFDVHFYLKSRKKLRGGNENSWSLFLRWILVEELILFSQDITQQEIAQREIVKNADWSLRLLPTDPNLQSWLFIRHPRNATFDNHFPTVYVPILCQRFPYNHFQARSSINGTIFYPIMSQFKIKLRRWHKNDI